MSVKIEIYEDCTNVGVHKSGDAGFEDLPEDTFFLRLQGSRFDTILLLNGDVLEKLRQALNAAHFDERKP